MKIKIVTWIAFLGLFLVLFAFLLKLFYPIDFNVRSGMLVIGFTLMLLGTIWRVVLEMNQSDQ